MSNKLIICAIKTEKEYYICEEQYLRPKSYSSSNLNIYFFNGIKADKTFCENWYKIAAEPKRIHVLRNQPNVNQRYELIDENLESDKIPAVLYNVEKNYDGNWTGNFAHLRSLYSFKSDPVPPEEVDVEFEFKVILVVDNIKEYQDFSYWGDNRRDNDDPKLNITAKSITHQVIDKIVFPAPILSSKPCSLSSAQSYAIIREYIKNNINPKVAEITSDYNFCFTVKKKVKLAKPFIRKWEIKTIRGKSYRPPKYNERYTDTKFIEVFEMTHAESKYNGYTVIPGFKGENQEVLKNNIDAYLEELIAKINTPLQECKCCGGVGVVNPE